MNLNELRNASGRLSLALLLSLTLSEHAALAGDAAAGASAWTREHAPADGSAMRSCVSCHTRDLTNPGRHAKTGKPIEPMAPSANPSRLRDPAKVEKWFRRNCRWTFGRECTASEKADFLAYIQSQ
jgi:hypothetical protein